MADSGKQAARQGGAAAGNRRLRSAHRLHHGPRPAAAEPCTHLWIFWLVCSAKPAEWMRAPRLPCRSLMSCEMTACAGSALSCRTNRNSREPPAAAEGEVHTPHEQDGVSKQHAGRVQSTNRYRFATIKQQHEHIHTVRSERALPYSRLSMACQLATLWLRHPRTGSTTVTGGSLVWPACADWRKEIAEYR